MEHLEHDSPVARAELALLAEVLVPQFPHNLLLVGEELLEVASLRVVDVELVELLGQVLQVMDSGEERKIEVKESS